MPEPTAHAPRPSPGVGGPADLGPDLPPGLAWRACPLGRPLDCLQFLKGCVPALPPSANSTGLSAELPTPTLSRSSGHSVQAG